MGLRIKNFNILGVHWKIRLLGRGVWTGGLGQFADLRGGGSLGGKGGRELGRKEEVVLLRGIDTPMHTMVFRLFLCCWCCCCHFIRKNNHFFHKLWSQELANCLCHYCRPSKGRISGLLNWVSCSYSPPPIFRPASHLSLIYSSPL